jgi:hypothetical protein
MGMIVKDDGCWIPDELWEQIEPLPSPATSFGLSPAVGEDKHGQTETVETAGRDNDKRLCRMRLQTRRRQPILYP